MDKRLTFGMLVALCVMNSCGGDEKIVIQDGKPEDGSACTPESFEVQCRNELAYITCEDNVVVTKDCDQNRACYQGVCKPLAVQNNESCDYNQVNPTCRDDKHRTFCSEDGVVMVEACPGDSTCSEGICSSTTASNPHDTDSCTGPGCPCNSVTYHNYCDGNTRYACDYGITTVIDCASLNLDCDEGTCLYPGNRHCDENFKNLCMGDILIYCDEENYFKAEPCIYDNSICASINNVTACYKKCDTEGDVYYSCNDDSYIEDSEEEDDESPKSMKYTCTKTDQGLFYLAEEADCKFCLELLPNGTFIQTGSESEICVKDEWQSTDEEGCINNHAILKIDDTSKLDYDCGDQKCVVYNDTPLCADECTQADVETPKHVCQSSVNYYNQAIINSSSVSYTCTQIDDNYYWIYDDTSYCVGECNKTTGECLLVDNTPRNHLITNTSTILFADKDDNGLSVTIYYHNEYDNPITGKPITAESLNPNCATVSPDSALTNIEGRAVFTISPNELDDCSTSIQFSATNATKVQTNVQVGNGGDDPYRESITIISPSSKNLVLKKDSESEFKVQYDGAEMVSDVKLNYEVANPSCIQLPDGTLKSTDTNGIATNKVKGLQDGCSTTVTVSLKSNDTVFDTLNVSVTDATEYFVNLKVMLEDTKRYDKVKQVAYVYSLKDADDAFSADEPPASFAERSFTEMAEVLGSIPPELHTFTDVEINLADEIKSLLVFGLDENGRHIIAYKAVPVDYILADQTIDVYLQTLPYNIIGEYNVVSNFDFSSGFEKTTDNALLNDNKYLPAEDMLAGDWIQFVLDLCTEPSDTILEFMWINHIQRLLEIKNSSGEYILNESIRNAILNLGKPATIERIKPAVEDFVDSNQWKSITPDVETDVKELVDNMQFLGTMSIPDADSESPFRFKNATESFDTLLYHWSFDPVQTKVTCVDKNEEMYYVNPNDADSCRVAMKLGDIAIQSRAVWYGSFNEDEDGDGTLNIPTHGIKFKWPTILYNAVFGHILPHAFGYSDYPSMTREWKTDVDLLDSNGRPVLGDDGYPKKVELKGYMYLTAFMDYFMLHPFVNWYNNKNAVDSEKYPSLSTTDSNKRCEQFIEALLYIIYPDAKSWSTVVATAGTIACGTNGIGQIDKLVGVKLNSLVADTDNAVTISSDDCTLYAEDDINYTRMGQPDDNYTPATQVFQDSSSMDTNRCKWDLRFMQGDGQVNVNGLFHAKRRK